MNTWLLDSLGGLFSYAAVLTFCSVVSDSVTPRTAAHQAPLSISFSSYICPLKLYMAPLPPLSSTRAAYETFARVIKNTTSWALIRKSDLIVPGWARYQT